MGRTGILPEISGITGFYELSCEHSETEYLRTTVGISDSDHPGTSSESDPESRDLEEAAVVDGANILQQIWYVQLPAIKNIIVIQFILQAGNIMSIGFEKAYALQTDMNLPASEILSTYVYRIGLLNGDYGYSTAVGLFNSVINVILLIFVNWVVKKLNDGEGL